MGIAHPLFPYFLEKCLAIPTSHLLVNAFSVIYIRTDPITLPCSLAGAGNNIGNWVGIAQTMR